MDKVCKKYLLEHDIDAVGVGIIDFNNGEYISKTYQKNEDEIIENSNLYFDLASLTKVLTNSTFYLDHIDKMTEEHRLLIEHRAGLPSWGLLSKNHWRKELQKFEVKQSKTLYSDFSALRFMIDTSSDLKLDFEKEVTKFYDKELKSWLELKLEDETIQNGYHKAQPNLKCVHDPNARNINEFISHAGLFSTTRGLCKTLININNKLNLLDSIPKYIEDNRYVLGWDRAEDLNLTTAGLGCSKETFGHLGFTGTSIWIDPKLQRAVVLLTNTTKNYWFDRKDLNPFRKQIGEMTWKHQGLSLDSYFY